jgi:hypothetical protein
LHRAIHIKNPLVLPVLARNDHCWSSMLTVDRSYDSKPVFASLKMKQASYCGAKRRLQ